MFENQREGVLENANRILSRGPVKKQDSELARRSEILLLEMIYGHSVRK